MIRLIIKRLIKQNIYRRFYLFLKDSTRIFKLRKKKTKRTDIYQYPLERIEKKKKKEIEVSVQNLHIYIYIFFFPRE